MKIFEFSSGRQVKMSPYANDMDFLVNKARELVDLGVIKTVQVPIAKILFTQPLDGEHNHSVEEFNEYDSLPFAVKVDGFYHLLDGHHRLKAAIDGGNTRVLLFVADADDEPEITEAKHKKHKHHQSTQTPIVPFVGRWWYGGVYSGNDNHDHDGDVDSPGFDADGDGDIDSGGDAGGGE